MSKSQGTWENMYRMGTYQREEEKKKMWRVEVFRRKWLEERWGGLFKGEADPLLPPMASGGGVGSWPTYRQGGLGGRERWRKSPYKARKTEGGGGAERGSRSKIFPPSSSFQAGKWAGKGGGEGGLKKGGNILTYLGKSFPPPPFSLPCLIRRFPPISPHPQPLLAWK